MDHSVEGSFINGYIYRRVRYPEHISDVHDTPVQVGDFPKASGHLPDHNVGEVDAYLRVVVGEEVEWEGGVAAAEVEEQGLGCGFRIGGGGAGGKCRSKKGWRVE
jgi:hypothetical protein